MAELVVEFLFSLFVQVVGRGVLWGLYAGRRPWSEFDDGAADIVGVLFWFALFGGIVIAGMVFGQ